MDTDVRSYKELVNSIIRPPREEYTMEDLGEKQFQIRTKNYCRKDINLINPQGHNLQCSHYEPDAKGRTEKALPCVIFCHGNWGSRLDALPIVQSLLPHNITVFTLDFAGSGRSEGEYVSLGWNEKDDIATWVEYLRSQLSVSFIGLWGQSMGAVAAILYSCEDPNIAGMVLDSPFSNFRKLWVELWQYHSKMPVFVWKIGLTLMRRTVRKKAKFDINKLDIIKYAKKCTVPWRFFYGDIDDFVDPSHSEKLFNVYKGEKGLTEFEGDHNSERPKFFYDSATIFFCNIFNIEMIEEQTEEHLEELVQDEALDAIQGEKLPELDNTDFEKIFEVIENNQSGEHPSLRQFGGSTKDQLILEHKKRLNNLTYKEKDEYQKAMLNSMKTFVEERDGDTQLVQALDQIGLLKQYSSRPTPEPTLDVNLKLAHLESKDDLSLMDAMKDKEEEGETHQTSLSIPENT